MGRLTYRDPLEPDEDEPYVYAEWLRDLMGASGAYVIRDFESRETLYVGESHSGQLYKTITRHFQRWTGDTAGTGYDPEGVEVAYDETGQRAAPGRQLELIERLQPADNTYGFEEEDEDFDPEEFMD